MPYITGFAYTIRPWAHDPSVTRVYDSISFDLSTYKLEISLNVERSLQYPGAYLTWRGYITFYRGNTLISSAQFSYNETTVYEMWGHISADKILEVTIGSANNTTQSANEFKLDVTFKTGAGATLYTTRIKDVNGTDAFMNNAASYLGGFPKLAWGNKQFLEENEATMRTSSLIYDPD